MLAKRFEHSEEDARETTDALSAVAEGERGQLVDAGGSACLSSSDDVVIQVSGLRKRYRLGQIGSGTLQGDLKERRERRREKRAGSADLAKVEQSGSFYALDGLDLVVRKGEALGIIGRNGAGKSTLLKILSRITAPTEGEIDLYGRVASMLEVGTGFDGEMTGRENVYLNGAILGMTRREIDAKMEDIIDFAEVREFIDTPVKRYSSGMFVKLGFSVAAHLDSEIMIMDEVLAVGDMEFQHKCLDKMRQAARHDGRTVLYVSHNMNTIKRLCDRCIVMDQGKIIFDGDVDQAIALYLGGADTLQRTRYEYDADYRPFDEALRKNQRLNMDVLEIVGKNKPEFTGGEAVDIVLTCTANRALEQVGFRFELWSQDGTKIASMLSGGFVDLHEGENVVNMRMDLTHLTTGQYSADLVAFLHDADGNEDILDGVYPGLVFDVVVPLDESNYLDWHHNYWGAIRLHDLDI